MHAAALPHRQASETTRLVRLAVSGPRERTLLHEEGRATGGDVGVAARPIVTPLPLGTGAETARLGGLDADVVLARQPGGATDLPRAGFAFGRSRFAKCRWAVATEALVVARTRIAELAEAPADSTVAEEAALTGGAAIA